MKHWKYSLIWLLSAAGSLIGACPAYADSWVLPSQESYISDNGQYRLTVTPTPIDSQLQYFREEVEAEEQGEIVDRPAPLGFFERKGTSSNWFPQWTRSLVNQVAPVSALVADDGSYFVTFDNWHSVGFGDNVIAIYTGGGDLIASYSLTDLVPKDYLDGLRRSISSVRWKSEARFSDDGARLQIDMLVPSVDREKSETILREIQLSDGAILPPDATRMEYALQQSAELKQMRIDAKAARLHYLTEPLTAPTTDEMRDWHSYLREAHLRLTPDYLDSPVAATKILFPEDHERHDISVGWLVDAFLDDADYGGEIAIASLASDPAFLAALQKATGAVQRGSLRDTTLYVSIGKASVRSARKILAPTGATIVWLDPDGAITQRPERAPGSPEERTAQEEIMKRQAAELAEMMDGL